jgi:hypothetical protein
MAGGWGTWRRSKLGSLSCQRSGEEAVRKRLRELAAVRRRFGYRRLLVLMRREGLVMNHKKFRLYREERLQVRRRGGRKGAADWNDQSRRGRSSGTTLCPPSRPRTRPSRVSTPACATNSSMRHCLPRSRRFEPCWPPGNTTTTTPAAPWATSHWPVCRLTSARERHGHLSPLNALSFLPSGTISVRALSQRRFGFPEEFSRSTPLI